MVMRNAKYKTNAIKTMGAAFGLFRLIVTLSRGPGVTSTLEPASSIPITSQASRSALAIPYALRAPSYAALKSGAVEAADDTAGRGTRWPDDNSTHPKQRALLLERGRRFVSLVRKTGKRAAGEAIQRTVGRQPAAVTR